MDHENGQVVEDFTLEHLPEWTNVRDLLAAIEEQLGRQVRNQIEDALDRDEDEVINVRGLLTDIQNELGGSYFDSLLQDEQGGEWLNQPGFQRMIQASTQEATAISVALSFSSSTSSSSSSAAATAAVVA